MRGDVRVSVYTDTPERFGWLESVYLSRDEDGDGAREVMVEHARLHSGGALIKLDGIDSRDAAETVRDHWLLVTLENAVPLEAGEYYLFQLLGLTVETESGQTVGVVTDLIETGANRVLVVGSGKNEQLIPNVPDIVSDIDFAAQRIRITPIPGLLNDAS